MPTVPVCDCCGQYCFVGGWHLVTIEDHDIPDWARPAEGSYHFCRRCLWRIRGEIDGVSRRQRGLAYSGWEAPRF